MPAPRFVPSDLHVLPDGTLARTLVEYRHALQLLSSGTVVRPLRGRRRAASDRVQAVARSMQEAVALLEAEVNARGFADDH